MDQSGFTRSGPLARRFGHIGIRSSAALLAAMLGAAAMIGSAAMGDEKSAEKANPEAEPGGDASDPYWTPERMRAARPLPLPHPDAAPPEAPVTSEGAPSVSGAGSPGGGSGPPEDESLPGPAPEGSAKP